MKIKIKTFLITIFLSLIFISCTTDLTLELLPNGSLAVDFSGSAGEAFAKMIATSTSSSEDNLFDKEEVSYQLGKSGFSNIIFESNKQDLKLKLEDKTRKSYIFTSGIVFSDGKNLKIKLSPENLYEFYSSCDENLLLVLDLLLSPVFNQEVMTQNEYLELVGSFYGESFAKEIKQSLININIKTPDGQIKKKKIPLSELLTLNTELEF